MREPGRRGQAGGSPGLGLNARTLGAVCAGEGPRLGARGGTAAWSAEPLEILPSEKAPKCAAARRPSPDPDGGP